MTSSRVGSVIAIAGAAVIASATLYPTPGATRIPHDCIICGDLGAVDFVLNVLLFIPLGLGLALRRTAFVRAMAVIVFTTMLVEGLQLTVVAGRSATLGDLLTNTIGGSLGYALGFRWRQLVFASAPARRMLLAIAALGFVGVEILTGHSLQPSPTDGTFFGQYARRHRDEPPFPGRVQWALVGACVVPNEMLRDNRCIKEALIRGDTIALQVAAQGTTPSPTAIMRVADGEQHEIAMLGADRDRALFSVRTRAAAMGLRAYRFALDSVFAENSPRVARLAGTFSSSSVMIAAAVVEVGAAAPRMRRVEMRLGPASGWRLLVPFRYYDDGSIVTPTMDALWYVLLLFPIGYWSVRSGRPMSSRRELALLLPVLGAATLICPLMFGSATPSVAELMSGAGGFMAGAWARRALARVDEARSPAHD